MNWIVTWVIVTSFSVACPQPERVADNFGITQPLSHYNLLACWDTDKQPMKREFSTREEAEVFIEQGKKKYPQDKIFGGNEAWATDWKLLEVKEK